MNVIQTHALEKQYGAKRAVNLFDMHVAQGDIYGFVGRNGAGKSTVMKMIAGLIHPTSGEIQLFGETVTPGTGHQNVGVLIENAGLYPHMSAEQNLMMKALCLGVADAKQQTARLLAFVGLSEVAKKNTGKFSMGMKQRLGLALALMGDPDVLLLDEPLNGLDPEAVREIRLLLQKLNEERGVTILISSHILDQLGKIATRYGIIRDGMMVRELTAVEVEQECQDYVELKVADVTVALALLEERMQGLEYRAMPNGSLRIFGLNTMTEISEILNRENIAVHGLQMHQRDLEEFFVEMMGDERHV